MQRSSLIPAALKAALKAEGWTARPLAAHLGVGEATVKRWLGGKGLTLERLEQLCILANMTLSELAQDAEAPQSSLARELTLAQERALSRDPVLAFLFIVILGGTPLAEIEEDFALPPAQIAASLDQLERLALIDRLRGGRIRARVDRTILWRKSPMRAMFEERMKDQFFAMDFSDPQAVYVSDIMKLSSAGAGELAELIEQHRREIQDLAERDRAERRLNRQWYALLSAVRPLDMTGLHDSE